MIELNINGKRIVYGRSISMYETSKNPFRKIFYYFGKFFKVLMDLCLGIDSGFKFCCIGAYITPRPRFHLREIQQVLCYKCYKKLSKQ